MPYKDKEKQKEYFKKYSELPKMKQYYKKWHTNYQLINKTQIKQRKAKWYLLTKAERKPLRQKYYLKTKTYQTQKHIAWEKNQFKTNALYRLNKAMGTNLRRRLNKNSVKWQTILGYTHTDLVNHLLKQFKPGMTLKNYGEWQAWAVDRRQ